MTAFAIFGSATSTSLTSRGRSRTADLPMPSERKRTFDDTLGILEVVGGTVSVSAAETGARAGVSASATAENDKAPTIKLRMDVRLSLRAIFFFLLVISVL